MASKFFVQNKEKALNTTFLYKSVLGGSGFAGLLY
jgi:hypothetical protein